MNKIAMIVHGGAGESSLFLRRHLKENEQGLAVAAQAGYLILKKGGSALDAVEVAVRLLEDNPLFNAGCGSALNCNGEVEMDASIMNGKNLKAGAVSMVRCVKNPISLARVIMNKTKHVFLSGYGALELAKREGLDLEAESYFVAEHQYDAFQKHKQRERTSVKKSHGTVGAVALDKKGNLAAGTSTGGIDYCLPGRVGDSCVIGAGCYANNETCAVSGTGEGEYLIRGVVANTISLMTEKGMGLQEACDYVIHLRSKGQMGVISINPRGEIAISFNTKVMKRAWMGSDEALQVKIYP